MFCFNPSQVFYKPWLVKELLYIVSGFQSLIGILQTQDKKIKKNSAKQVSIPHRYSTNTSYPSLCININSVSIPHRYSTNYDQYEKEAWDIACFNPSQVFYKLLQSPSPSCFLSSFQSLIGILQTISSILLGSALSAVSIPHRYSTNLHHHKDKPFYYHRFNPSQVFYKRLFFHL